MTGGSGKAAFALLLGAELDHFLIVLRDFLADFGVIARRLRFVDVIWAGVNLRVLHFFGACGGRRAGGARRASSYLRVARGPAGWRPRVFRRRACVPVAASRAALASALRSPAASATDGRTGPSSASSRLPGLSMRRRFPITAQSQTGAAVRREGLVDDTLRRSQVRRRRTHQMQKPVSASAAARKSASSNS